jgi:hypothetical protein
MKIDIIGSIIVTLCLMLLCYMFRLDIFGCILLMIFAFVVLQYRCSVWNFFHSIRRKFWVRKFKVKKKECKSSYEHMEIDE